MMKGMGKSPEEWSTLVTSKDLYCLWISLVFFSDFFFWSGNHVIAFCLTACVVASKNILYC